MGGEGEAEPVRSGRGARWRSHPPPAPPLQGGELLRDSEEDVTRLLVISNRVRRPGADASQGGLAVALGAALRDNNGLWFGWSGERTDRFTGQIQFAEDDGIRTATVDLEDQDIDEYYNGYANRTLWPLFHYRIDLAEYDRAFGEGYERVNRRLADTVRPLIEPEDLVWVHDYHLLPLGYDLRRRGVRNRIGFFLHIPGRPPGCWSACRTTSAWCSRCSPMTWWDSRRPSGWRAFAISWKRRWAGRSRATGAGVGEQRVKAVACPIGIDFADFSAMAEGEVARATHDRVCRSLQDRRMIVGVGPAGLFQGPGRAVQRLGPGAARPAGVAPRGGDGADRTPVALRRGHLPRIPGQARLAGGPDQRRVVGRGLDAHPLRQSGLWPRRVGRHLPRRARRPRHPPCATA